MARNTSNTPHEREFASAVEMSPYIQTGVAAVDSADIELQASLLYAPTNTPPRNDGGAPRSMMIASPSDGLGDRGEATSACAERCRRCVGCCRGCWWELCCGAGREVGALFCCPPFPSRIAAKLAFAPPEPSYDVREDEGGARWPDGRPKLRLWLREGDPGSGEVLGGYYPFTDEMATRAGFVLDVAWIKTHSKHYIPAFHLQVIGAHFTLLYSHANGTDIGEMFDWFAMICVRLNVNVFAYEYTGYGAASGRRPLEGQVKMDADAAWRFLTEQHGTPPDRVVLYGQSIGSGATCWLGQRYEPAGLVLHASIMSGLRVMIPVKRTIRIDPFPNIELMPQIRAPVAVMHGDDDQMIAFEHGERLFKAAAHRFPPLWIAGGDHNNLSNFPQFYEYLEAFLAALRRPRAGDGLLPEAIRSERPAGLLEPSWSRNPVMHAPLRAPVWPVAHKAF